MIAALSLALPFLKRFGPWIAVALIALGVWAGAQTLVKDWRKSIHDAAYKDGQTAEANRQDAIARRVETILTPKLQSIDDHTSVQLKDQNSRETQYADRVQTKIKTIPVYHSVDCSVDAGMLDDRNQIRASLSAANDPNSRSSAIVSPTPSAPNH